MATLDLLQASMVAVNSDSFSGVSGKPPEKRIIILRPGMLRRFFARLRTARSMVRAPKSACAVKSDDIPIVGTSAEATVTAAFDGGDGVDQHQFGFFLDDHAGGFGGSSRLRRLGRRRGRLLLRTC